MSTTAMKQALEALNYLQGLVDTERGPKAAAALRQAIEQAEKQEFCDTSAAYMVGVQDGKKQREWVGLNANEYAAFYNQFAKYQEENADVSGWFEFAEAVEAKLKEKNT
jgi:hypothetical protein